MESTAADILKKARERKNLRQEDIANTLGISVRQYNKYEAGEFPKYKKAIVVKIDELLGTNLVELIYEQDIQERQEDLEGILGNYQERLLRTEATLEVFESAIAELLSKNSGDFKKKMDELRELVNKAVNRRFDEFGRKR